MNKPIFEVGQVVQSKRNELIAGSILGVVLQKGAFKHIDGKGKHHYADVWWYELQAFPNGIGGFPRRFEIESDLELTK